MRRLAMAVLVGLLLALTPIPTSRVEAAPTITGAGSTFAQIAIDQWRADVARTKGLQINYSGQGSSQGRRQFISNTVDFASSDIAFEPEELPVSRPYSYLPLVAGGTALMYNLVDAAGIRITNLQLSGPTIAKIFTGEIRQWDHADIMADNPQLVGRMPAQDIKPVVRSGGSGTSAVFTGYMAALAPGVWQAFAARYGIPGNYTSSFPDVPGFIKQSGSDGIANFVANPNAGKGSIGYAEAGYALQRGLPMASVRNEAGQWTQPTARNVGIALTQATRNPDGTQNLDRVYFHNDPSSYAISSYNYMIVQTTGFDPAKGDALGQYIIYAVTEGQAKAEPLGYSPLPPNLIQQALDVVATIPGAPTPPDPCAYADIYVRLGIPGGPTNCNGQPVAVPGAGPEAAAGPGGDAAALEAAAAAAAARANQGGAGDAAAAGGDDEVADEEAAGPRTRFRFDEDGNLIAAGADGETSLGDLADSGMGLLLLAAVVLLAVVFVPPAVGSAASRRRRRTAGGGAT
jgi:phosphate ABC transporter phosphate-binding protein